MNRQEYLEYLKQWRKNNPDKVKEYHKKWNPITSKRYNPINSPKRLVFKDKRIFLTENPRKGICSQCGKTGVQTQIHHFAQYHDDDPLRDTIELCASCHAYETWKQRKEIEK